MIASSSRYETKICNVNDRDLAYVEVGSGDPILFLHGNPTSSYLWRNVIPYVENVGRCIAPDLIGMGKSDKIENSGPGSYRFVEHREYLDGFLKKLGIEDNVCFVLHDWGSALGFDWAKRHRDGVRGIAYMEALVCPVAWDDWPKAARSVFQGFRSMAGEAMILDDNLFVEKVLPASILRKISIEEMEVYRRPYLEPGEGRRPMLTWPREIPINGNPHDVVEIVTEYGQWLVECEVPKLFINAEPGAILVGRQREFCRTWTNQTEVTVRGSHFLQEDSPGEIGQALADWLCRI